jgi:lipopolysaccharide biosynthesis glycosyltransferase
MKNQPSYCVATVTSKDYFQWTMTMLFSFVESNPWYQGDFIIIGRELPAGMKEDLKMFGKVCFLEPSEAMISRIDRFILQLPSFRNIMPRFLSLETFRIKGYDKILFLDSDLLVVRSVEPLFSLSGSLCASAELCYYKGKGRETDTFLSKFAGETWGADFIENPVNTGVMLLNQRICSDEIYQDLLMKIEPDTWRNLHLTYTDELIINQYFKDKITLLDSRYNYRARAARILKEKEEVTLEDAVIIHYYAHYKPWNFEAMMTSSGRNLNWLKAYEIWYQWYDKFLRFYHLQKKIHELSGRKRENHE